MQPPSADSVLTSALNQLPQKPEDSASRAEKQNYSQSMSAVIAVALAEILRSRGCDDARPAPPGTLGGSGAERRLAGGIGAKKVDVTWTTEESGLLLGISVKTINFRDKKTKNYQKNLTNRRGDMLIEAVSLHRRFPYAVLAGMLFLDHGAARDETNSRNSTFENAHPRTRLFTGRHDPADREEQYEGLYIVLAQASPLGSTFSVHEAGSPTETTPLDDIITKMLSLVAERNFDFYEMDDLTISKI